MTEKSVDEIDSAYDDVIPEDLGSEEERGIRLKLLARDVKQILKVTEGHNEKISQLENTVKNGGLKEIQNRQSEILDKLDEQTTRNTKSIEVLKSAVELARDLVVPIVYTLGGGILLYLGKILFFSELF